ncbi:MAG: hypothetical protein KatS3mg119_1219 [Rhodothalassiaceae bacterium]|nr:MAG: hypothetical protein KatS3mg119_1219 [Rhodothalassiaceae bacterium]
MAKEDDRRRTDQAAPATRTAGAQPLRPEVARFLAELEARAPARSRAGSRQVPADATGAAAPRANLLFALDATMSRQPTWDLAVSIQADMFLEAAKFGGLAIKLVYFRGLGECRATGFVRDPVKLAELMTGITCRAGRTQIARVLRHAVRTAREDGLKAMVYVGDCCEENPDQLAAIAGELAILGVPIFLFHEGGDAFARRVFEELARITKGAALAFDPASPHELAALLKGVAAYAAGGDGALQALARREAPAGALLAHLARADGS